MPTTPHLIGGEALNLKENTHGQTTEAAYPNADRSATEARRADRAD